MRTVAWHEGKIRLIDQRQLPWELVVVDIDNYTDVAWAINGMVVRGAPAIGAAAAFGMALAARQSQSRDREGLLADLQAAGDALCAARPTAVNLSWAVARLLLRAERASDPAAIPDALLAEVRRSRLAWVVAGLLFAGVAGQPYQQAAFEVEDHVAQRGAVLAHFPLQQGEQGVGGGSRGHRLSLLPSP